MFRDLQGPVREFQRTHSLLREESINRVGRTMSRNVFVELPNKLVWPKKCARCGASHAKRLGVFRTAETRQTILPLPLAAVGALYSVRTLALDIDYPICEDCWSQTRKRAFLSASLSRLCVIAFGVTFAMMMLSAGGSLPHWIYPLCWGLVTVEVVVLMVCALATAKVPVRINNLRKDSVELVFSDDRYAKEFEALNRPYARYVSKTRSLIGLKG